MRLIFISVWIMISLVISGCFIESRPAPAGVAVIVRTEDSAQLKRLDGESTAAQWDVAARLWVSVEADDMPEAATAQVSKTSVEEDNAFEVSLSVDAGVGRRVTAALFVLGENGLETYAPDEALVVDLAEGENHEAVLVVSELDTGTASVSLADAEGWKLTFDDVTSGLRLPSFACLAEENGAGVVTCRGDALPVGRALQAVLLDPESRENTVGEPFTIEEAGQAVQIAQ